MNLNTLRHMNIATVLDAHEAALQRAGQLVYIDEMRRFVAEHGLRIDTSGDGRVRGVKDRIKAQIISSSWDEARGRPGLLVAAAAA